MNIFCFWGGFFRYLCRPRQVQGQSRSQTRLLTAEKQTFGRIYRHCWLWKLQPLTVKPEWPQFPCVIHRKHNKYKKKKIKENDTSFSYSHQIRSKGLNAEQQRPHVAADWIKIPTMRQLKNLKEPTRALIILLPSVSLTNSLLTLQMAVMQEGSSGNARHRLVFTGGFED